MDKDISEKAREFATEMWQKGYEDGYKDRGDIEQKNAVGEMEYQRGLEDAWECARKIVCPSDCYEGGLAGHVKEIFGYEGYLSRGIFKDFSAFEAIDKIKKYEERQTDDKIKVGDEVVCTSTGSTAIVTAKQGTSVYLLWRDGSCGNADSTRLKKTGRNFNKQIDKILKELKEES